MIIIMELCFTQEKIERIIDILQGMLDRMEVTAGTAAWEHTQEALRIAISATEHGLTYQRRRSRRGPST